MYKHELEEQIKLLKDAGVLEDSNVQKAKEALYKYWNDKIAIVWMVDDVFYRAREIGKKVTREQAINILDVVLNDHDANLGVAWDTFDYYMTDMPDMTEEEKLQAEEEYENS